MTYNQSIRFLYESLPMYQRVGAAAYKANLNNTIDLLNHFQNPQQHFKAIHIAGTNGKGSLSHNLASILQEKGYIVGLYTSPHLKTFRERIRINGQMIDEKYICQFVENNRDVFNKIQPSFFEMTVAMAFTYFSDKKVDIAVVEVGMGGRLDSTNLINPDLTIISNIDYDHMQFLGNTLPEIAKEKAGIIKENVPVVIGETHAETEKVFMSVAAACNAPIVFADQHFSLNRVKRIRKKDTPLLTFDIMHYNQNYVQQCVSPLTGIYQEKNFLTLAAAFEILKEKMNLSEKHFKNGIKRCIRNTGLQGRWQRLQSKPLCIADIGHNEAGIRMNVNQLKTMSFRKLHIVLGVVNDKDIDTMLALLPKDARYYFCKANIPRGLKAGMLKKKAKQYGLHGSCYPSVKEAYKQAKSNADSKDVVFVGGSAFTVAEVI